MVAIVVGGTGGGYSVTGHTVEQCTRESMLVKEKFAKGTGAEVGAMLMGSIASNRHARKERSSRSFLVRASSDSSVLTWLIIGGWPIGVNRSRARFLVDFSLRGSNG